MSEQLRESISAAMDGEADAFELRRVLDEATHDDELREQWHRFHLMRDLMRDSSQFYHPRLREGIRSALQQPQSDDVEVADLVLAAESSATMPTKVSWLGRIGGTAVAAAVAAVVMINGGVFEDKPGAEFADREFSTPDLAATQAPNTISVEPVLYQRATDLDKQRQNALMLHHIQQRAMNQAGMTSFVKMATFTSTRPEVSADAATQRP